MNVGFIGLGVMGRPMAENLINGGHTLHLHRVDEASASLQQLMNATISRGDGELEHSAFIRTLETPSGQKPNQSDTNDQVEMPAGDQP